MAISENQLQTWSHQGSVQQSAATYESIRRVLNDPRAPYAKRGFDVFLQGSYGNSTNVWSESDVDIFICTDAIFYSETDDLSAEDRARYNSGFGSSDYSFDDFKREVTSWLRANFGGGVVAGNKAIFVPAGNGRRDADVLASVQHRRYYSYPALGDPKFHEGICFWTAKGEKIVNYPKQHMANCTAKHGATTQRFKPSIRVVKNMRNAMIDANYIGRGVAPSYFIEGMLYNVPSNYFTWNFRDNFERAMGWLELCDATQLECANERYFLIREGSHVCWNMADFRTTISSLRLFWNTSNR